MVVRCVAEEIARSAFFCQVEERFLPSKTACSTSGGATKLNLSL